MKYRNLIVGQIGMLMTQKSIMLNDFLKSNILTAHPKDIKRKKEI